MSYTSSATPNGDHGHSPASNAAPTDKQQHNDPPPRKSALAKAKDFWLAKTGIDVRTYKLMFKGALAPTIAVAAFQSTAWAETYTTVGYLVGIMTILSIPISPRAKFLQTTMINIFASCLSAAVSLLTMYCCVRARINSVGDLGPGTGGPGTSGLASAGAATAEYNSSASAVAGVWLFVEIYFISVIRARRPQLTVPCIISAIFANVAAVYSPQFSTMTQAETFARHLLQAFLTGFALATGVSLLIFPVTSRHVVFGQMARHMALTREIMRANLDYTLSLEDADVFAPHRINTAGDYVAGSKEADVLSQKLRALQALSAQLHTELPFAKREVAWGKLGPDNLQEINRKLRLIMIPTVGMSSMSEIFRFIAEERGWDPEADYAHASLVEAHDDSEKARVQSVLEWHELIKVLRRPFKEITEITNQGLEHVAMTLQFTPQPKTTSPESTAEMAAGDDPAPGTDGFLSFYQNKSLTFLESKKDMLRSWCRMHDIELPQDFFDDPYCKDFQAPAWMNNGDIALGSRRLRRQLFMSLYMEFLLFSVNRRVYDFMLYAESLKASGKLSRKRLVVPGLKRLRKWGRSAISKTQDGHDEEQIDSGTNSVVVELGDAFGRKRDPEHLPPATKWESATDKLRAIPHFFRSSSSSFGLRVACATLSIAVAAFLHDTQTFYSEQRIFWAQIMISISMSPTAGQSVQNFMLRIFGTFLSMILAWIAYYIVDGKTAGVLVFFFIALHYGPYVLVKYPQYRPVGMIGQVTLVLIIGYEFQVRKLGVAEATSNGQAYYPIYELGPIRLATVCGGLLLAWIWTMFPYPISEHSQVRQNLGRSLYLLANYYSILHETVNIRLRGDEGDLESKTSPGFRLTKARQKVFTKCSMLLSSLRAQSAFVKFDIPVGGKFPSAIYQEIINRMQSALNFMTLISIASATFNERPDANSDEHENQWVVNLRRVMKEADVTTEAVTSLLSLLSASVARGSPLPPYLRVPEAYGLVEALDRLDQDILSVRHVAEPGYASFAVIQLASRIMLGDLKKISKGVRQLVGELDFSYHIVSTNEPSRNTSETTLIVSDRGRMKDRDKAD